MIDEKPKININIDSGVKIEVKTEVPASAAGRAVDAFLDMVSPLTEFLGLQGDKLRVHRHVTLQRTIREAQKQLDQDQKPLTPVPIKTIVPLLEHASQEEPEDDYMVDKWAKLLASAAQLGGIPPRFVSLLSELNGRQAAFLASIPREGGPLDEDLAESVKRSLGSIFEAYEDDSFDTTSAAIIRYFKEQGQVRCISVSAEYEEHHRRQQDEWYSVPDNRLDVEILGSLGLVRVVRIANWYMLPDSHTTIIEYLGVTSLGVELLNLTKTPAYRAGHAC